VPELEFRRAELRAALSDVDGALALPQEIVLAPATRRGACWEKLLASRSFRQRVAKILEPLYESGRGVGAPGHHPRVEREGLKARPR
jgi:hypothetical protein